MYIAQTVENIEDLTNELRRKLRGVEDLGGKEKDISAIGANILWWQNSCRLPIVFLVFDVNVLDLLVK